ncbi:diguanylate cyclase [Bradyrhizobium sp. 159]|nr:diguanylate cyclase [Bradyrhizobium sp. 159]MCK1617421.1 diguanylate cyclase [Bradyrhizobium sp. 159]
MIQTRDANLPATVLMCDIDRFKAINDQFGA